MYIVLDECRSTAQPAPKLYEVKESSNANYLLPCIIAIYNKIFIEIHRATIELEPCYCKYPYEDKPSKFILHFVIQ